MSKKRVVGLRLVDGGPNATIQSIDDVLEQVKAEGFHEVAVVGIKRGEFGNGECLYFGSHNNRQIASLFQIGAHLALSHEYPSIFFEETAD
ncbi:MAG: hypothetical protein VXX04_02135 [Actinomycetota bacterium]|nr:hypothetical protein [Actinomycetota bacterium]MEC7291382.1 hypothetical protein [Pseudomonadota bacterium]